MVDTSVDDLVSWVEAGGRCLRFLRGVGVRCTVLYYGKMLWDCLVL